MWLLLVIIMGVSGPQEVLPMEAYYKLKDCEHNALIINNDPDKNSNVSAGCVRLKGLTIT